MSHVRSRISHKLAVFALVLGGVAWASSPAAAVCTDADGDGFGAFGDATCPNGTAVDCNDADAAVFPFKLVGLTDLGNGIDNDCDGLDECAEDADFDGAGDQDLTVLADTGFPGCNAFEGESAQATDCDDTDPFNFPGNFEVCDGQDNNCDTDSNPGNGNGPCGFNPTDPACIDDADLWDQDSDGFTTCGADGNAATLDDNDCDDLSLLVYPGAPELIDGLDNDCDGLADEGAAAPGLSQPGLIGLALVVATSGSAALARRRRGRPGGR